MTESVVAMPKSDEGLNVSSDVVCLAIDHLLGNMVLNWVTLGMLFVAVAFGRHVQSSTRWAGVIGTIESYPKTRRRDRVFDYGVVE